MGVHVPGNSFQLQERTTEHCATNKILKEENSFCKIYHSQILSNEWPDHAQTGAWKHTKNNSQLNAATLYYLVKWSGGIMIRPDMLLDFNWVNGYTHALQRPIGIEHIYYIMIDSNVTPI